MTYLPLPLQRAVVVTARFAYNGFHLNRFSYIADADLNSPAALAGLSAAFQLEVINAIRRLQVDALVWTSYYLQVLQPGSPYFEDFNPQGGIVTGVQGMPAYVCYSFRYTRPITGVRGGFKRFSGVPENYTEFGAWSPNFPPSADITAVRTALLSQLSVGSIVFTPAIFIQTFNGQQLPFPHYYVPTNVEFRLNVGTQMTRKP